MGTELVGDHLSRGTKFWGPFVHGNGICWRPFVQGDRFYGDHLSGGTESPGPEVHGSNGFGTKCVAAEGNIFFGQMFEIPVSVLKSADACTFMSYTPLCAQTTCEFQRSLEIKR